MEEILVLKNELLEESQRSINGLCILVAEDNDSNYLLIKHMFKNCVIERAKDGKEVVEMAKCGLYDIILMDIKMPVLDGYIATSLIRCFDTKTPIVALTANAFDLDREKALCEGCSDYVTKPIKKQELIDVILNLL